VYLKSLTLKGFKSFADPTTLELESGITVIVGPNGSGKSNVVDAVAWVLGAQGPKVVRSGKMDDVIFAGTSKRPALGRAEVTLTIDNTSGKLPVDLNEINIKRTLFRTGDSEYQINGASCRLLDIQELLSDAGVGRTQHIIISQGQLDAILQARQEDRRSVIEEAAGILKYRRRKERAERRLEASESALSRLEDLYKEVKRQVRPLERQAKAAQSHSALVNNLKSLGIYLSGRELAALDSKLSTAELELEKFTSLRDELGQLLEETDRILLTKQDMLDRTGVGDAPLLMGRVGQLLEQSRGMTLRLKERLQAVESSLDAALALPDLGQTKSILAETAESKSQMEAEIRSILAGIEDITKAEKLLASERQSYLDQAAAEKLGKDTPVNEFSDAAGVSGDAVFGRNSDNSSLNQAAEPANPPERQSTSAIALSKNLNQQVLEARNASARERAAWAAAKESETRLLERLQGIEQRRVAAGESLQEVIVQAEEMSISFAKSSEEYAVAEESLKESEQKLDKINESRMLITAELHGARAKAEALEFTLNEVRSRAGIEHLADNQGVLGTLLDVVDVQDEAVKAFEAAIGPGLGSAVLVRSGHAQSALEILSRKKLSATIVPVPLYVDPTKRLFDDQVSAPESVVPLRPFVLARDEQVSLLLDQLLGDVWLCQGDLSTALKAYLANPASTIVTSDGSCFSPNGWRLVNETVGATQAAFDRASQSIHDLEAKVGEYENLRSEAESVLRQSRRTADQANRNVIEQKAQIERLQRAKSDLSASIHDLIAQEREIKGRYDAAVAELDQLSLLVAEKESYLKDLEQQAEDVSMQAAKEAEIITERAKYLEEERNRERAALESFDEKAKAHMVLRRDLEVKAALLEERHKNLTTRQMDLEAMLEKQTAEVDDLRKKEPSLRSKKIILAALLTESQDILNLLAVTKSNLEQENKAQNEERDNALQEIRQLRQKRQEQENKLTSLAGEIQKIEMTIVETQTRIQSQQDLLTAEFNVSKTEAVEMARPEIPPGLSAYDYQKSLQRELRLLGPVNSLAEDELKQLREREVFLETQLSDVRSARRELNQVIRAIDKEIVEVFFKAYNDVAEHFEQLFSSLFPGGHGKLSLTSPDDLLNTGIEIEAKPAGRNIRRLSLLSGGERSLVAMAFLFSVFRSRPSPFYLMDEVEAALDEVNLRRFLKLVEEFRDEAQLIIVSHQKKTMEVADALYGISMAPGASSKAVSEKIVKQSNRKDSRSAPLSDGNRELTDSSLI